MVSLQNAFHQFKFTFPRFQNKPKLFFLELHERLLVELLEITTRSQSAFWFNFSMIFLLFFVFVESENATDALPANENQSNDSATPSPDPERDQTPDESIDAVISRPTARVRSVEKINASENSIDEDVEQTIPATFIRDTNNMNERWVFEISEIILWCLVNLNEFVRLTQS